MSVAECRTAVPLGVLWGRLGLAHADKVGRVSPGGAVKIKSPFREDKNPSFSVWMNAEGVGFCKDHGNGEDGYDEIGLIERALGMDTKAAILHYHSLAGVRLGDGSTARSPIRPAKQSGDWKFQ